MATKKSPTKKALSLTSKSSTALAKRADSDAKTQITKAAGKSMELIQKLGKGPKALAPNTDLVSELNNIDFRKMIGGPLQAAVDAQVASSLATVSFINNVGFSLEDPEDPNSKKTLVMVDFSHERTDFNEQGVATPKTVKISVPLLAMLPIPSLRIEHVLINFNVKLNSVETETTATSFKLGVEAKAGWGPVSFKVSSSYQRNTTTGVKVEKEYALNVNVKAVQDEIPAGLEKILNMLAA
jgi:hypothetical protein